MTPTHNTFIRWHSVMKALSHLFFRLLVTSITGDRTEVTELIFTEILIVW